MPLFLISPLRGEGGGKKGEGRKLNHPNPLSFNGGNREREEKRERGQFTLNGSIYARGRKAEALSSSHRDDNLSSPKKEGKKACGPFKFFGLDVRREGGGRKVPHARISCFYVFLRGGGGKGGWPDSPSAEGKKGGGEA